MKPPRDYVDGTYRRQPFDPVGPVYAAGAYVGRYPVPVHAGRRSAAPRWWTVRLLPARGPLCDGGSAAVPSDTVSGDPWALIECGVQGTSGSWLASWPQAHVASVNVYSSSVQISALLSAAEIAARIGSRGPFLTAQIIEGQSAAPTGLRWTITGGPVPGEDLWYVPVPPGARAYRIANRPTDLALSVVQLSQLDWSTPSVGTITRQADPPLVFSTRVVAVANRVCDSATHVLVDTSGIAPVLAPGEFDITFDIATQGYDAV
jgi:hypothetical protein